MTKKTRSIEQCVLDDMKRGTMISHEHVYHNYESTSVRRIIADLREDGHDIITANIPFRTLRGRWGTFGAYFLRRHKTRSLKMISISLNERNIKRSSVTIFEHHDCSTGLSHHNSGLVSNTWRLPDVK